MKVHALHRHPIKGHGVEALDRVRLTAGETMPWDRRWAAPHEAARIDGAGWAPCRNFGRGAGAPALMAVTAEWDEAAGRMTLSHPDRPELSFDPDTEGDLFVEWAAPLYPEERPRPVALIRAEGQGMTDAGHPWLSIHALASLRAVEGVVGRDLSLHRWRGNVWLDGPSLWEEDDWIGRRLRLGNAVLEVKEPIYRCRATEANPETGRRDADTLGALTRLRGEGETRFGVYAEVVEGGEVAVGDGAALL